MQIISSLNEPKCFGCCDFMVLRGLPAHFQGNKGLKNVDRKCSPPPATEKHDTRFKCAHPSIALSENLLPPNMIDEPRLCWSGMPAARRLSHAIRGCPVIWYFSSTLIFPRGIKNPRVVKVMWFSLDFQHKTTNNVVSEQESRDG